MTPLLRTALITAALMFAASAAAVALRPTHKLADAGPKVDLEAMIPKQFGDWRIDTSIVPVLPAPDVQAKLDKIYNQTLARTYINNGGQRVMLSIAYGGDQSGEGTQVHRPEYCYAAQGFRLTDNLAGDLITEYGKLPVQRLMAALGQRNEPITYWITVGDKATLPGIGRKLNQIAYGLTGRVPDGMLVRVSSIDPDKDRAYQVQEDFIGKMLATMEPGHRVRLTGKFDH